MILSPPRLARSRNLAADWPIRGGKRTLSFFFLVLWLSLVNGDLAAQTSYQGQTIRVVVGSSSGGGYDLWARLLALYLGKYVPGNPAIVVQNMPGAGGTVAANYIYGVAKPDGLTLGAFNPGLYFDQLIGRSEVKFDWSKFT